MCGHNVKLERVIVVNKSEIQKSTRLSTTEAETVAGVTCEQDIMYVQKSWNQLN